MSEIRQFKLVDGSEIVCEVIEWIEEGQQEIIVRDIMIIAPSMTSLQEKVYVFKTWLHYIESRQELVMINSGHVIAIVSPNPILLEQYQRAIVEMHLTSTERRNEHMNSQQRKFADIANSLKEIFEEEEYEAELDSDSNNIIKFPVH